MTESKESVAAEGTSATPAEGSEKNGKRIVYLNTHLFGSSYPGKFVRGLAFQDDKRAEAIGRHILSLKPDVVILSQIWHENQAAIIRDKVKEILQHCWYPIVGKKRFLSLRMDSGMMVLSNEPLEEKDLFEFPDLTGYDGYSRKCVCTAVLGGVLIAGTDVQVGDNDASLKCRKKNITNIKDYLNKVASKLKIDRVILVGDMNTSEQSEEYKSMTDEFAAIKPPLRDALRILSPSQSDNPGTTLDYTNNATARHWGPATGESRVDYFFVSEGITVKQQETLTSWKFKEPADAAEETEHISDHYAISLVYE